MNIQFNDNSGLVFIVHSSHFHGGGSLYLSPTQEPHSSAASSQASRRAGWFLLHVVTAGCHIGRLPAPVPEPVSGRTSLPADRPSHRAAGVVRLDVTDLFKVLVVAARRQRLELVLRCSSTWLRAEYRYLATARRRISHCQLLASSSRINTARYAQGKLISLKKIISAYNMHRLT